MAPKPLQNPHVCVEASTEGESPCPQGRLQSPPVRRVGTRTLAPRGTRVAHLNGLERRSTEALFRARDSPHGRALAPSCGVPTRSVEVGRHSTGFSPIWPSIPLVELRRRAELSVVHRDATGRSDFRAASIARAGRTWSFGEAATELGLSVHTIKSERAGARIAPRGALDDGGGCDRDPPRPDLSARQAVRSSGPARGVLLGHDGLADDREASSWTSP